MVDRPSVGRRIIPPTTMRLDLSECETLIDYKEVLFPRCLDAIAAAERAAAVYGGKGLTPREKLELLDAIADDCLRFVPSHNLGSAAINSENLHIVILVRQGQLYVQSRSLR
nr:hypothetical protein [Aspergillus terreus chrysovirus 1]